MPLYEYECSACHKRTEKIQKFSDPELTVCPYCGGPLARTITAAAFSFAGGGWYKDGYGSTKPAAEGGGSASPDAAKPAVAESASGTPAAAATAPAAPASTAPSSPTPATPAKS